MNTLFDILKKDPNGNFHWIEAVHDIETAKTRLKKLSAESSEEFVVFQNIDLRIVASSSRDCVTMRPLPARSVSATDAKQGQAT